MVVTTVVLIELSIPAFLVLVIFLVITTSQIPPTPVFVLVIVGIVVVVTMMMMILVIHDILVTRKSFRLGYSAVLPFGAWREWRGTGLGRRDLVLCGFGLVFLFLWMVAGSSKLHRTAKVRCMRPLMVQGKIPR